MTMCSGFWIPSDNLPKQVDTGETRLLLSVKISGIRG